MTNLSIIKYLLKRITAKKKISGTLHLRSTKQLEVLVLLRKHCKNNKNEKEKSILLSHFNDHVCSLKKLCKKHNSFCTELKQLTGTFLYLVKTYFISLVVQKQVCV